MDSPWDRYLSGEQFALSPEAKRGALIFFGQAGCATCQSGNLLTDQQHHNIAVPQLGPGKGEEAPQDFGRFREAGDPVERFAFRTPPLRNVALTGPWMHDGALLTLEAAVRHHPDPEATLRHYDSSQLRPDLRDSFQGDEETITALLAKLDSRLDAPLRLSDQEIEQLITFLRALTDPAALDMRGVGPTSVTSGLSIDE